MLGSTVSVFSQKKCYDHGKSFYVPSSKVGSEHNIEFQARGLRGTTWGSMQFMDGGQPRDK